MILSGLLLLALKPLFLLFPLLLVAMRRQVHFLAGLPIQHTEHRMARPSEVNRADEKYQ